ncbi:MAG: nicotinate phosphoribosyltransferase, partial [Thermoleophilia bacterium]|nr:hypothetical protein [Gaiellaceae bacterium]MDW8337994.1 nicotinate phosphoribosyltransferase [Thermoleophilia bacterium]
GFGDAIVFVSGGLDEHEIASLVASGAPIGGFGVGTKMGVSADAPFLDIVYKAVELDGRPVLKLSEGKATLPGRKQVWRVRDDARAAYDVIGLADDVAEGEPLLVDVMRDGRSTWEESLDESRARALRERASLPEPVRALSAGSYPVRIHPELEGLRARLAAGTSR